MSDPIKISNLTDLQNISIDLTADYELENDIDASETETWNWDGEKYQGWLPLDTFTGSLDGKGFKITGLHINRPASDKQGLFSQLSGVVSNLHLEGKVVGYSDVALLAGSSVSGGDSVISNCSFVGDVFAARSNAGIVCAFAQSATISQCFVSGNVFSGQFNTDFARVGGLSGYTLSATINNCYSFASVVGRGYAPQTPGTGGLVGVTYDSTLVNCYSVGTVSGEKDVGGLVGYKFEAPNQPSTAPGCFWDTTTSGVLVSALGDGRATSVMQSFSTFDTAGWDIAKHTEHTDEIWSIIDGADWPRLADLEVIPQTPTVQTLQATDISGDSCKLHGRLTSMGIGEAEEDSVEVYFKYRVHGSNEWQTTTPQTMTAIGLFEQDIDGISPYTIHAFRAVVNWE